MNQNPFEALGLPARPDLTDEQVRAAWRAIAAALSLLVLHMIPGSAAAPADVFGLALWFVLSGRRDLAPPPER